MFLKNGLGISVVLVLFVCFGQLMWVNEQIQTLKGAIWTLKIDRKERDLSINLGNGECKWTNPQALGPDTEIFGTLLAAYPGSGVRLLWQHAEGLTGTEVGDDYNYSQMAGNRSGIIKTAYPNTEGIWSWGDTMKQVVLLVSNPRWAIPSYHTLLSEIDFAYDWGAVFTHVNDVFHSRPTIAEWIRWRDLRFHDEVMLWKYFINYWMEGGKQYWMDGDFERNGQYPCSWLNETEMKIDEHCIYDLDCYPKAVLSYELLKDPITGPNEANKLAKVLDGKLGFDVIEEEARTCVWHQVDEILVRPDEVNRDKSGKKESDYRFTYEQLLEMRDAIVEMRDKYNSGKWAGNVLAQQLVGYFSMYLESNRPEIEEMRRNQPPTSAPNADYQKNLGNWYKNIGRGNRYGLYKNKQGDCKAKMGSNQS